FLVVAGAVVVPRRALHELLEGLGIAFAKQVARALPAEHGTSWIPPGRAMIGLVAGEEVEEQTRLVERPFLALASEDVPEKLPRSRAIEEMLLIWCALIGVARRNRDAIDAERHNTIEEARHALRIGAAEQRAVDIYPKAFGLGGSDRRDGTVVDPGLANRSVMHLLVAVEMHGPIELGVRPILRELFLHQQRIGADGDVFALGKRAVHDFGKLPVQQRLAASEYDHWRTAFIDGLHAVGDRKAQIQDFAGIVDA